MAAWLPPASHADPHPLPLPRACTQSFPFHFPKADMPHESYEGLRGRVRYFLRAVVSKSGYGGAHLQREQDFLVQNLGHAPEDSAASIKLEVGIEDCLHIEFEYDR
jgi:vacuolar protein sorting-associated protein 26